MEEAHAIVCEGGRWVCNEKGLIEAAGLTGVLPLFAHASGEPADLLLWVDRVADRLGETPGGAVPWKRK
jgi:hypothetical protein